MKVLLTLFGMVIVAAVTIIINPEDVFFLPRNHSL